MSMTRLLLISLMGVTPGFIATVACAASYEYDELDRLSVARYEFSAKETYTYDAAGNLLSVIVQPPAAPGWLAFPAGSGAPGSAVSSASVTVAGLSGSATVSVSNGQYSLNGGAFTNSPGRVSNGDRVVVQISAPANAGGTATAILSIAGASANFTVTSGAQQVQPFTFAAIRRAQLSTAYVSNAITVSGVSGAVPITVSGGSYSINGGAFTSAAGSVNGGQSVRVQVMSPARKGASASAMLNVGGTSGTFTVSTSGGGGTPWLMLLLE